MFALNGTHAYYNGGNVGVGTMDPAAKLEVIGGAKVEGDLVIGDIGGVLAPGGSFESSPSDWLYSESDTYGYMYGGFSSSWSSDGSYSYRLYNLPNSIVPEGNYGQISQAVDLTDVNEIVFDLKTGAFYDPGSVNWIYDFRFQVLVDGTVLYERGGDVNENQTFTDQFVNVSAFSGSTTIAFRFYSANRGSNLFGKTFECFIDNVRLVSASGEGAANVLVSGNIILKGSITQGSWSAPTLLNGWQDYGGDYSPAGYFRDKNGIVHLRGLVKGGSGAIFVLPEGYRPAYREIHAAVSNNTLGRCDILPDGSVQMVIGQTNWISLDGISFRADEY